MHNIYLLLIIIFPLLSFSAEKKSRKILPSHLQKGYVVQKNAFVYTRPDFDAVRITGIPAGMKVTISKKVYRSKTGFGSFYRIYISTPRKMRAYISEIDVVSRYIRSKSGWKVNPEFALVKKKLNRVKEFQHNVKTANSMDLEETPLAKKRFIGMTVSYSWLAYEDKMSSVPTWLFGLKISGKGLPIEHFITDINLIVSVDPPVIDGKELEKGYLLLADFLFKKALFNAPSFMFQLGAGFMGKLKGALRPEDPSRSQMGGGLVGASSLTLKIHNRMSFLIEGKGYYDFLEKGFVPAVSGGLLVAF